MTRPETYIEFVTGRFKIGSAILEDAKYLGLYTQFTRLHAVIGLITELDEIQWAISTENLIEEIGDYYFYLVGLESYLFSGKPQLAAEDNTWEDARHSAAVLLDLCKRECLYCKTLNDAQVDNFMLHTANMRGYFNFVVRELGMTEEQIQQHNMAKLNKRYPKGYSNEAANARADKKEGE